MKYALKRELNITGRYGGRESAKTMAHELGHYLGLHHTHQFTEGSRGVFCWREPVTRGITTDPGCFVAPINFPILPRRRCSYTGDFLCDTEADPNLTGNIDASCNYTGTKSDYWGERFRPLGDNYMSYGNRSCRATFTKDQVGAMWWTLLGTIRGKSGKWRVDLAGRSFDIYEPNNTISGAINFPTVTEEGRRGVPNNLLRINESQLHSFHKDIDGGVMDNFDWIPIERPEKGILDEYVITVESDIINLVEDIEVFTAANPNNIFTPSAFSSPIVSTSLPNQTRWTISIPCDSINSPTALYLRVRRNQNLNEFGTYTVLGQSNNSDIEISVVGEPETICTGTTYLAKLENFTLTEDFTIVWQDSLALDNGTNIPFSEIVAARNQAQATFSTNQTAGIFILQAIITNVKTGCSETLERRFRIGRVPEAAIRVETVNLNSQNEVCPNSSFLIRFDLDTINFPLVSFDSQELISTNPEFIIGSPSAFGYIQVRSASTFHQSTTIVYRVTNECGTTEIRTIVHTPHESDKSLNCREGGEKPIIGAYPNPTDDFIDIDIICMCGIDPADPIDPNPDPQKYSISRVDISDMFGTTRLSYEGSQIPINPDGKIRLNLSQIPAGNYILKLVMQDKVYMKHVIKQ